MTILHDTPHTKAAVARRSYFDLAEYDSDTAAAIQADMAAGATPDDIRRNMAPFTHDERMTQWYYRAALYLATVKDKPQ